MEGTAKAKIDNRVQLITENQPIDIPLDAIHQIENRDKAPMVLIAIQTDIYLGMDDIILHKDVLTRN